MPDTWGVGGGGQFCDVPTVLALALLLVLVGTASFRVLAPQAAPEYNKYSFEHVEDWGEQLTGVSMLLPFVIALNPAMSSIGQTLMRPRVFAVNLEDDGANTYAHMSLGQPVFAPGASLRACVRTRTCASVMAAGPPPTVARGPCDVGLMMRTARCRWLVAHLRLQLLLCSCRRLRGESVCLWPLLLPRQSVRHSVRCASPYAIVRIVRTHVRIPSARFCPAV
jgi:hypothetical protein